MYQVEYEFKLSAMYDYMNSRNYSCVVDKIANDSVLPNNRIRIAKRLLMNNNYAKIRGSGNIGGIAAYNCGLISECRNYGDLVVVYKGDKSIGGIVGYNFGNGEVLKCNQYSNISFVGLINGALKVGAIVGHFAAGVVDPGALGSHGSYNVGALGKGKVHMFGYGGYVGKKDV